MRISTLEQLLDSLDQLFDDGSDWTRRETRDHWATLFSRPDHPLNSDLPDANLLDWQQRGLLPGAEAPTALDLGCGLGRNTRWLARQGDRAVGIDLSTYAVAEARRRSGGVQAGAPEAGGGPAEGPGAIYAEVDVLREPVPGGPYDLIPNCTKL